MDRIGSDTANFSDTGKSLNGTQSKWFANMPGKSPVGKILVRDTTSTPGKGKSPARKILVRDTISTPGKDKMTPAATLPTPPVTPKRSQGMTYRSGGPETIERSNLLSAIDAMVSTGLRSLSKSDSSEDIQMLRLKVYRDAFQHLINEFNLYKPFLTAVKNEYDTLIDTFSNDLRMVSDLKMELRMKEHEFSVKLKANQQSFRSDLIGKSTQILNLTKELQKKDDHIASLKSGFEQTEQRNIVLEKELNELRKSCEVLTNSLTRSDEEKRLLQLNDTEMQRDLQGSKMAIQKANEELERVRNLLSDAESVQATLVGPEVVMKHVDTIRTLKNSLAHKNIVHNRLIDRYSTLKSAVEHSAGTMSFHHFVNTFLYCCFLISDVIYVLLYSFC